MLNKGERWKYTGKKVCLNRVWNSQPPGHEFDMLTTEPSWWGTRVLEFNAVSSYGKKVFRIVLHQYFPCFDLLIWGGLVISSYTCTVFNVKVLLLFFSFFWKFIAWQIWGGFYMLWIILHRILNILTRHLIGLNRPQIMSWFCVIKWVFLGAKAFTETRIPNKLPQWKFERSVYFSSSWEDLLICYEFKTQRPWFYRNYRFW